MNRPPLGTPESRSRTAPWDDPRFKPSGEASRIARYRRLQSWYREVQLGAAAGPYPTRKVDGVEQPSDKLGLGSLLRAEDVAAQPDLNFIDPAAFQHARRRMDEVPGENGSLEAGRLQHNLLSSMPLCFNLFGALGAVDRRPAFLALFKHLFDPAATSITEVICEWAPTEVQGNLKDRTAFDAVVFYERSDGAAFMGIETKYTEPFSQKNSVLESKPRYEEVTRSSGWFHDPEGACERLNTPKANQLWRNLILAGALDIGGSKGRGSVAVVALAGDPGADKAMTEVSAELGPDVGDRLLSVSFEAIVEAVPKVAPELEGWADRFRRRYLDVGQPDDPNAGADPHGPRLGRTLTRP